MAIAPKKSSEVTMTAGSRLSFLESIVQSSDNSILGVTPNGIIKSWNKGAEKMFGYTEKEIIGQPIVVLLHKFTYILDWWIKQPPCKSNVNIEE